MQTSSQSTFPLCVDLDGTLIRTDLLAEGLLILIKQNPLYIFCLPFWLLKGVAALKTEIAKRISIDPALLPYDRTFLDWLRHEKNAGRSLWLCTGAPLSLAAEVADYLNLFDGVLATTSAENFTGKTKARGLTVKFGEHKFDYCGNEQKDMAVWRASHRAIVVNASAKLEAEVRRTVDVAVVFPSSGPKKIVSLVRALRLPQWIKNILIFVPLITAHRITDVASWKASLIGLLAFSLCASSIYLLNDMLDLAADRQHPRKSKRPFASGDLPLLTGFAIMPLLLAAAFLIASVLPGEFSAVLAGYYLLTTAYSFVLKRMPNVDILCLACLYTVRIIAGGAATGVPLSFWLLLFSFFLFLSLALIKRCTELDTMLRNGKEHAAGRGYQTDDLALLKSFGIAAGYLSVLVLALYIDSPAVKSLYRHPQMIWFLCLLMLYWIMRIWLKTHRGQMLDDPIAFALKDKVSFVVGLLALATLLAAT